MKQKEHKRGGERIHAVSIKMMALMRKSMRRYRRYMTLASDKIN
jgi:hypothetical protein